MKNIYYHNPKCSKSRQGLELLYQHKVVFIVKEYLKESLSLDEIIEIVESLGKNIFRHKEVLFKELGLDKKNLTNCEIAQTICQYPKLLERPILKYNKKIIIGRPIENLLCII